MRLTGPKTSSLTRVEHPDGSAKIPNLDDDEDIRRIDADLLPLEQHREWVEQTIERLKLERSLASGVLSEATSRNGQLFRRLEALRAAPSRLRFLKSADEREPTPAMVRAAEVMSGMVVAPSPTLDEQLAQAREHLAILRLAIDEKTVAREELRKEKSRELAMRLKQYYEGLERRLFYALREAAQIIDDMRELRARVVIAGYEQRPDILHTPFIPGAMMLGSESLPDSQIATWRRILEERQVL